MMKSIPTVFAIVLAVALSGCSYSSYDDEEQDTISPSSEESVPLTPALAPNKPEPARQPLPFILSYAVNGQVIEKTAELKPSEIRSGEKAAPVYRMESTITMPVTVPDSLRVKVAVPVELDARVANVFIQPDGQPGGKEQTPGTAVSIRRVDEPSGSGILALDLSGLRSVLPDHSEEERTVNVILDQDSASNPVHLEFRLRTPPSNLDKVQLTTPDYEKTFGPIPGPKTLRSLMARLDLLQVIRLRNPSSAPKVLTLPLKPKGKLSTRVTTVQASTSWCGYSISSQEREDVLSRDLFILPIDGTLARSFAAFIDTAIVDNSFEVAIDPGQTATLGIYASGDRVASLTENGHARSSLQPLAVPTACRSRCGNPARDAYHWDVERRAGSYWGLQGWPGASRVCDGLRNNSRIMPEQPHPDEAAMNQCAEWELHNGLAPWDVRRFCQSMPPGNPWGHASREYWTVTKTMATVHVGTQTYPIHLELDPATIVAKLRYADTPASGALEIRTLPQLVSPATKQAD